MKVNKQLKIKLESRHPDTGKLVGKATFKLDNEDFDIWTSDPIDNGVKHFKEKYMEPFSQLCCEVHCLLGVNTTGTIV